MRKILNFNAQARRGKARICVSILSQSFSLSLSLILMFVQVLLLFLCYYYEACTSKSSYRQPQPSGNGQLLSRRYCKHSGWLFIVRHFVRRHRPKALWRFRASTSNSLSGRSRPQTHKPVRHIHHTYARQDIEVYEDDQF